MERVESRSAGKTEDLQEHSHSYSRSIPTVTPGAFPPGAFPQLLQEHSHQEHSHSYSRSIPTVTPGAFPPGAFPQLTLRH